MRHELRRPPTDPPRGGATDMDLAEAEQAAFSGRPKAARTGMGVADVDQPWD